MENFTIFIDMCLRIMQIYAAHKYKFRLVYSVAQGQQTGSRGRGGRILGAPYFSTLLSIAN